MCLSKIKAPFEVGDLIEIVRNGYKHWGVYAGDGKIIHLTCDRSGCDGLIGIFKRFLSKSVVKCAKLEDVAGNCDVFVNNFLDGKLKAKLQEEILQFAQECLGKEGYSILFGNCETFANMCRYGNPVSFQIGCFGANVAGAIAGAATAGGTLYFSMTLAFLEELVITLVIEASKPVLLSVGLGVASNIVFIVNIGYIFYTVYQVVTSETFQTIFKWLWESFSDFLSGLYSLVARTVSRLMSAPQ